MCQWHSYNSAHIDYSGSSTHSDTHTHIYTHIQRHTTRSTMPYARETFFGVAIQQQNQQPYMNSTAIRVSNIEKFRGSNRPSHFCQCERLYLISCPHHAHTMAHIRQIVPLWSPMKLIFSL